MGYCIGIVYKDNFFTFRGMTSVEMNSNGTLLLSSSKDNSNRLWDVRMVFINEQILIIYYNNKYNDSIYIYIYIYVPWFLIKTRPIKRLKGHQNTSKNFIRSGFVNNSLIVGGSEVKEKKEDIN